MSDVMTDVMPDPILGSLEARVAEQRNDLESQTTELFDVPGFDVFKVELRVIGAKQQHAIFKRHEHVRDEYQQNLRTAADLIVVATVAFHAVDGEGQTHQAEGASWKRFAKAYDKTLPESVLNGPGGSRVALIRLLTEENVLTLAGTYKLWLPTRGSKVERELEDF